VGMTRVLLFDIKKSQKNKRQEKVRQPSLRDMYENMYVYMNIYIYIHFKSERQMEMERAIDRERLCVRERRRKQTARRGLFFWTHTRTTGHF